ncbi:hypothetical protein Ahy_B06g081706 [Arachis hypogaea]|uniref:Iron hydrogenase small subunit domain-containing protein n=1 Tax=Arachis hypogaea TaxID=3818 RepID=A0A444YLV3_ARAHY|nr:hypothetical protein Ahy_B06g081706 [Arachis hypogaea]
MSMQVEGKTVLRFDLYYDFWNLKFKTGKYDYHFLEIMACPSTSCLNGTVQIKPKKGQSLEELRHMQETIYIKNVRVAELVDNPILLCDVCGDSYVGEIKFGLEKQLLCLFLPSQGPPLQLISTFLPFRCCFRYALFLTKSFNSLGAIAIFDISCSRDFTLIKFCMEFMSRYKQSQLFDYEKNKSSLPMIASACPEIYHVTVMPCYDKMLEATRDDFVIQLESHDERSGNEDNMVRVAEPFNNPIVRGLYDKWLEQLGSDKAKRHLHTQYHPVEKNITFQLHNW